ncbi:MAG: hypothetical protein EOO01_05865 [Chitinophagaceae bacterium]|nr:MAG: hypothetical protein EOO01_05865 [Chitinophagaceae bacterium]
MLLRSRFGGDRPCGRLQAELLKGGCFLSVDDARTEFFEYIKCYYNRVRKHCASSPVIFTTLHISFF